jgi:hypothetical protein
MSRSSISYARRSYPDRRKTDGLLAPWITERRVQPERRGIEVTEIEFDERIALGLPSQAGKGRVGKSQSP